MIKPPLIKKGNKKFAVLAFSDIDGTVNDQRLPESERLSSINPAKEAIKKLQEYDIPVGLITARSFGETLVYKNALNTNGFMVSEDGAIVILPKLSNQAIDKISKKYHIISHEKENVLILSKIELPEIKNFLGLINKILKESSNKELITSCTSKPELLKELINYETLEDTKRAIDRLASAYVRDSTDKQFELLKKHARERGMRVEGEQFHAHILGADADKGSAIQFINDHISEILPDLEIDGILPIVFGNDYNDLRLFEEANSLGGLGIIVKDSNDTFKVSENKIPSYVIKTEGANGFGMLEAIKIILSKIKTS